MKEHGLLLAAEGRPSSAKSEQIHYLPDWNLFSSILYATFLNSSIPYGFDPLLLGYYFKDPIAESCRFLSGEQAAISAVLT